MRRTKLLAVAAAIVVSATGLLAASAQPARKAPEFVFEHPNGKQTLLSSYRGKDVVLVFMHTTCPHCQKAAPMLARLQDEYGSKGVQFLGAVFNKEAKDQVDQFVKLFGVNFPVGYTTDTNVLRFLGFAPNTPTFVPMVIVIDKTGMIRAQHVYTGDDKADAAEKGFFKDIEIGIRGELEKMLKASPATAKK